jgi:hypothetical protein
MAKGDKKKVDTAITAAQTQSTAARGNINTVATTGYNQANKQGQDTRGLAQDSFLANQGNYNKFLSTGPSADYTDAMGKLNASYNSGGNLHNDTFDEFAQTGGFSPTDAANFRARGNSPISAAYSNARDEMMRGNSLQGGYGGNFAAAQSQLARQGGAAAAQAGLNTEASLAEQIRAGRMGGAQGQAGLQTAGLGHQGSMAGAMGNLALGQDQNRLTAMSGLTGVGNSLTNLYGTSDPNTNAYLSAILNNQSGQEGADSGLIGSRIGASSIPTDFSQGLANVGGVLNLAGKVAGSAAGLTGVGANPTTSLVNKVNKGLPTGSNPYANLPSLTSSNIYGGK